MGRAEWLRNCISVEQVAELLGLHVRTVRNYVRDGRLKAVRIGKQYRISRANLEELTGSGVAQNGAGIHPSTAGGRGVDGGADRRHRPGRRRSTQHPADQPLPMGRDPSGQNLRLQTIYDEERASMKIVIFGGTRRYRGTAAAGRRDRRGT